MESLAFAQTDSYHRINKSFVNFKKSPKERITRQYIENTLERLEELWKNFTNTHNEIIKTVDLKILKESEYYNKDFYSDTEELYIEYKCLLHSKLSSLPGCNVSLREHSNNSSSFQNVQLPKIAVPKFSGSYSEWTTFKDLFMSLVHNTSIDKALKMQYLKGSLTGEAEMLVRHINIAADNYDRCWAMIEERYSNTRVLSHNILKRLFNQRNVAIDSASGLKELLDTTSECLGALSNLGIDVSTWDILIIHMLSLRLDPDARKQWELQATSTASKSLPTFEQFKEFLTNRFRALEFIDTGSRPNKGQNIQRPKSFIATSSLCKICNSNHRLGSCKKFISADVQTRRDLAGKNGLCFNCLGSNHTARECRLKTTCRVCNRNHHTLLHEKSKVATQIKDSPEESGEGTSRPLDQAPVVCFSSGEILSRKQVLLATALIGAEARDGERKTVRAILDQGSQASFITEATAQYLGLKKIPVQGHISGVGQNKSVCSRYKVNITLVSLHNPNMKLTIQVLVLKKITAMLPGVKLVAVDWVCDLPLADPQYHTPNKIDMLLGAEVYSQVIQEGIRRSVDGMLVAQCTSLGWILFGATHSNQSRNIVTLHTCMEENDLLRKFWEIESDPIQNKKRILSEEEIYCEDFFKETTTRDKEGRYVVRLPFKKENSNLQIKNSKKIAERRLNLLSSRLSKSKDLKQQYTAAIDEYLQLNHVERIPSKEINKNGVYLSHFAVLRYDKDTTKVRVVFDASCKGENGVSLNDLLIAGPSLQPELRHLLLRWRLHRICLSADIVKMFLQIKVAAQDTDFQRILWKEDYSDKAKEYRLLRVTFGTACAPYLAVKVLQQVAIDEGASYPKASEKVATSFYMDDLLTGCDNIEEGKQIYNEMNELLGKAGFKLQKWSSNSEELLEMLQKNEYVPTEEVLKLKVDEVIKLLGLSWNRKSDAFRYSVTVPNQTKNITKRTIISDISRLYDPLGWVAPSVIVAKILIQKLWMSRIDWDDEVPSWIVNEWTTYRADLVQLGQIRIPRWINTTTNSKIVELHGFSDASKVAYAAVVYIRVIDNDGKIYVSLLTAKTKVAPIKQISIPRLELCAALLVTKLLDEIADVLNIPKKYIHAWTDSTVVLAWLNNHPSKWKTFVGNRVAEIITTLEPQCWSHVKSENNPADCASRGLKPSELVNNDLWFNGPRFLREEEVPYCKLVNTTDLEETKVHLVITKTENFWDKFSSLKNLIRVIAYCRRVLNWKKCKDKQGNQKLSHLSTLELKESLNCCVKESQKEHFKEEIIKIQQKKKLKGPLKSLNPYFDENEILRVGGRLQKSYLDDYRKHPIILPKHAHLTKLIIADAHLKTLHGGSQLMLTYIQSKYWILGAKEIIKSYVRKCIKCIRYAAPTNNQLMGQLPTARVTPSRPFKCSGVDYAGPISIRTSKGRGQHSYKGYICLFVCMATKAVHIEAVTDLSTQGFLAAFKRFVSRRGICSDIWSDNGTNFLGASKELHTLFAAEKSGILKEIAEHLAQNGTNWHFIPPRSPNFGGLWEAGIKSVKHHLRRVIGDTKLTYEELSTLLAQIEACLNSRPLSRLNNESDGFDALTPGHFLIGEPLLSVPDYDFKESSINSLRRWQLTQRMMQNFWRRWSQEYLTTFLRRYKWSSQIPEPNIGDLVLIKEDDLPPSRWLLGRVVSTHPGADGITRVVSVQTKSSTIKRPTSKICILPVSSS